MVLLVILINAVILSVILFGGVFLMIYINPRTQLRNYPDKVKIDQPERTNSEKRVLLYVAIPSLFLFFSYSLLSYRWYFNNENPVYIIVLLYWFSIFVIICLIDLFIVDYLIFCKITPGFILLPGTTKDSGYKDFTYHLKTIPNMVIVSIVGALFFSLTYFIF